QFLLDDREHALLFRENVAQILDRLDQLFVFVLDLVALEPGQLIQAKIENLVGLMFAERVTAFGKTRRIANQNSNLLNLPLREIEREQFHARFLAIGRSANDADELVEIRERDEITFKRFGALFGFP